MNHHEALEKIAALEVDWKIGPAENLARAQNIAEAALNSSKLTILEKAVIADARLLVETFTIEPIDYVHQIFFNRLVNTLDRYDTVRALSQRENKRRE